MKSQWLRTVSFPLAILMTCGLLLCGCDSEAENAAEDAADAVDNAAENVEDAAEDATR